MIMVLSLSQKALTSTTVYTHGMMSSLIFFWVHHA